MVGPRPYWLRVDSEETTGGTSTEYRLRPSLDLQTLTIASTLCNQYCIFSGNDALHNLIEYHDTEAPK